MGRYAKGYLATFGGALTVGLQAAHSFCDTWLPALVAFGTAVGVIAVPNAKRSDDQR